MPYPAHNSRTEKRTCSYLLIGKDGHFHVLFKSPEEIKNARTVLVPRLIFSPSMGEYITPVRNGFKERQLYQPMALEFHLQVSDIRYT